MQFCTHRCQKAKRFDLSMIKLYVRPLDIVAQMFYNVKRVDHCRKIGYAVLGRKTGGEGAGNPACQVKVKIERGERCQRWTIARMLFYCCYTHQEVLERLANLFAGGRGL